MAAYDARNQDLRHHAPRRHPGRGRVLLDGGQGPDRPAPRQPRHPLHRGRLAGLAIPRTCASSSACRTRCSSTRRSAAFGATRRPGVRPQEDANIQALVEAGPPGGHHLRQVVGLPRDRGARHDARREPRDDRRLRSPTSCKHFEEVIYDAEHFFDGFKREPRVRAADAAGGGGGGRPLPRALRHQRRQPAARDRRDHPRGQARR